MYAKYPLEGGYTLKQTPHVSSNIKSSSYNESTGEMLIEFKNGGMYLHFGVTESAYIAFTTAPSVGKAYHAQVRGKYDTQKMQKIMCLFLKRKDTTLPEDEIIAVIDTTQIPEDVVMEEYFKNTPMDGMRTIIIDVLTKEMKPQIFKITPVPEKALMEHGYESFEQLLNDAEEVPNEELFWHKNITVGYIIIEAEESALDSIKLETFEKLT